MKYPGRYDINIKEIYEHKSNIDNLQQSGNTCNDNYFLILLVKSNYSFSSNL